MIKEAEEYEKDLRAVRMKLSYLKYATTLSKFEGDFRRKQLVYKRHAFAQISLYITKADMESLVLQLINAVKQVLKAHRLLKVSVLQQAFRAIEYRAWTSKATKALQNQKNKLLKEVTKNIQHKSDIVKQQAKINEAKLASLQAAQAKVLELQKRLSDLRGEQQRRRNDACLDQRRNEQTVNVRRKDQVQDFIKKMEEMIRLEQIRLMGH